MQNSDVHVVRVAGNESDSAHGDAGRESEARHVERGYGRGQPGAFVLAHLQETRGTTGGSDDPEGSEKGDSA